MVSPTPPGRASGCSRRRRRSSPRAASTAPRSTASPPAPASTRRCSTTTSGARPPSTARSCASCSRRRRRRRRRPRRRPATAGAVAAVHRHRCPAGRRPPALSRDLAARDGRRRPPPRRRVLGEHAARARDLARFSTTDRAAGVFRARNPFVTQMGIVAPLMFFVGLGAGPRALQGAAARPDADAGLDDMVAYVEARRSRCSRCRRPHTSACHAASKPHRRRRS